MQVILVSDLIYHVGIISSKMQHHVHEICYISPWRVCLLALFFLPVSPFGLFLASVHFWHFGIVSFKSMHHGRAKPSRQFGAQ